MKRLALLLPLLAAAAGCARGPGAVSATGSSTVSSNALRTAVGIRTIHKLEWRLHERREPAAAWAERLGPSAISDFGDGIPVEHWVGDEGRGHEEKWVVKDYAGTPLIETDSYYSGIHYSKPDGAREEKTLFVEYDWRISALRIHYFGDPFDASDPIPAIASSNTVEAAASILSLWGLPLDSAATNTRAEDPATNAAPVYLASMLDLGSSSTARNQEVVTAEGVWLANLRDRHPGGCIRTIQALLATNGVEVRIDVLPGTEMKPVPTSNGIVRLEPVKLREWVNHEKVLVPFADVPCVVQLKKWADVFGNEAWSRVLLERRDPSAATLPPPRIETAFSSKSSRDAPSVLAATNRSDRAVALLAVETVAGKHKSGFRANPAILRLAPGEGGTIEIRRDPIPLGTPILTLFDLSSGIRVPVAEFPATP